MQIKEIFMDKFYKGMDVSSLLEVEECGGIFFDEGRKKECMEILKGYGTNLIRLRLWNDPYDELGNSYGAGHSDYPTTLKLAKRAKRLGMEWLLDLHYSDCWADPGKQRTPKIWQGMNATGLANAVYTFTFQTLENLKKDKCVPDMVAVGNELTNGLLWPVAQVPAYDNIARILSSGIKAVRDFDPSIPIMIHLDNGGNNELYRTWFDAYFANGGSDFEYIGLSYYPFWHGTLEDLKNNMNDIAVRYDKKLIVAEVSTAHTLKDYQDYEKLPDELRKGMATKPDVAAKIPYPMTEDGQAQFLTDFLEVVKQVPDNKGCGFIYWEPAWLPVPGSQWATEEGIAYMQEKGPGGNEWANQALFDYDGNSLRGLQVIKDF